jgi:hypothetical protein
MTHYGLHLILKSEHPVVSLVVFLKGGPPGLEIREVRHQVGPFEPLCFRYLAFGLSGSLAEDYVDLPQALAPALAALMRSKTFDRVEHKLRCLRGISRAEGLDVQRQFVLAKIVNTHLKLQGEEALRFSHELAQQANKEVHDMVVTWEEALAEREAIGEARGEAIGEARATQQAILQVARKRHAASLQNGFEQKIRSIHDLDRLNQILEQILDAGSLDDLDLN